jgi:hypothetical protein
MSDVPSDPEPPQSKEDKKDSVEARVVARDQSPDRADVLALGIGCAVFVVMFIAIVLVGISGR